LSPVRPGAGAVPVAGKAIAIVTAAPKGHQASPRTVHTASTNRAASHSSEGQLKRLRQRTTTAATAIADA
jgi:hypothetical protein